MRIELAIPSLDEATKVTSRGFVRPITDELREDVSKHLVGDLVYSLIANDQSLAGFATFRIKEGLLYLSGVQIDPSQQGKGLVREVIMRAATQTRPTHLALRTQSPRMWAVGRGVCTAWYPSPGVSVDGSGLNGRIQAALELSGSSAPIDVGKFGQALYGEKPLHHDERIQEWWDDICNFNRGDAVVCVGTF